ncbi:MAG: DUF1080 domain-containing protein [Planctomycetes bacterium]|nr:DUF1080 domain-containing protein [Planctomycetota bacterium]
MACGDTAAAVCAADHRTSRRSWCEFRLALAFVAIAMAVPLLRGQQSVASEAALFAAQGEYAGPLAEDLIAGAAPIDHGAQVIALAQSEGSEARLRLVLYRGGLPGAGWQQSDPRRELEAEFGGERTVFADGELAVTLADGELSFRDGSAELGHLTKIARQSPTLGAAPPPGAVVLFDGSSADAFEGGRLLDGGVLGVGCDSRRAFADHRLHLEFKTPFRPAARGQGRGNSGVYVQGRFECQVLDSFGLEGRQNECGGIYSVTAPLVNACLPPETWQTYDIVFTAARYDGDRKVSDARMTVHLNGILVHDDVALPHATTASRRGEGPAPGGLYLQDHGNPVVYRNIWVVEREPGRRRRIVLLPGRGSHGYAAHEHRAGCLLLAAALHESGLPVEVEVHDVWPDDDAVIARADVIVCFADGGVGHPLLRHLDAIGAAMTRGTSLVCLHYAVEVPKGRPGERFLDWLGGYFETDWSVNPMWTAAFPALPGHPITRGVRPFTLHDEWYFHMRFRPGLEGTAPILSAVAPAETMQREDGPHSGNAAVRAAVAAGESQHLAWARVRPDGGRAFGFTGAHVHWNWAHDDFRKLVLNAIVWAAWLDVPDKGVPSVAPDLAALQANQNSEVPANFDAAAVQRLLDAFGR